MATKPTLGQMADTYYQARAERLALGKKLDELKKLEAQAEQMLIDALRAQGLEGCKGSVATAAIKRNTFADVTDWGALEQHILATGDFALMQKRVSVTAVRERFDNGDPVPGVELGTEESISLTKVA